MEVGGWRLEVGGWRLEVGGGAAGVGSGQRGPSGLAVRPGLSAKGMPLTVAFTCLMAAIRLPWTSSPQPHPSRAANCGAGILPARPVAHCLPQIHPLFPGQARPNAPPNALTRVRRILRGLVDGPAGGGYLAAWEQGMSRVS